MKRIIICAVVISLGLVACKKERTCELNEANFTGVFKVKSVIYKYSASDPGTDQFLNWDNCKKDDLWHIEASHITFLEDAGILCSPGGNGYGTWSLSGNTIFMHGQSGTVTFFDCRNTEITFPQQVPNETITLTLVRQ